MRSFLLLGLVFSFLCGAASAAEAPPANAYFPILPLDAAPDAVPQLIPVATNQQLETVHSGVTRAIVVIHDEMRDATGAMGTLASLAGGLNASTMIIAPQFVLPSDIVRFAERLPEKGKPFAAWQVSGWMTGDDSMLVPGKKSISSFTVVDLLLMYLSDRRIFPDLRMIVVAGYGAGANFTQRYAAFGLGASAVALQGVDLRYVVAGATSYFYPTSTRPLGGKKGFGMPDTAACPAYNAYPYGSDNLNPYARRGGVNAAKLDYGTRAIMYLNVSAPDIIPDISCAAAAQGTTGLARAQNYRIYLRSLYGDAVERGQKFLISKETRNDAATLFGSACGMSALFGDGSCAAALRGDE